MVIHREFHGEIHQFLWAFRGASEFRTHHWRSARWNASSQDPCGSDGTEQERLEAGEAERKGCEIGKP